MNNDSLTTQMPPLVSPGLDGFSGVLVQHNIELRRIKTSVLQINVGRLCNQRCRHCHLSAGPESREIMSEETAARIIAFAGKHTLETIDITGGAPELNPHLGMMIQQLRPLTRSLILRCNLSALGESLPAQGEELLELMHTCNVDIIASFPALSESQLEAQRGKGMFECSIRTLKRLNSMGWGVADSPLLMHLVSNPAGAFLPPSQEAMEKQFRRILHQKWGISFNSLFTFANVPLGRFREWLIKSGNYKIYLEKLSTAFNPCALDGVMCRNLISVNWDGCLYDCDFNIAADLPMGGRKTHISELESLPDPGTPIAVADHCFTCTAGTGFT